jgi:polyisoprenyl-teichoic acid--peptidoglycan teichoic acid transferase
MPERQTSERSPEDRPVDDLLTDERGGEASSPPRPRRRDTTHTRRRRREVRVGASRPSGGPSTEGGGPSTEASGRGDAAPRRRRSGRRTHANRRRRREARLRTVVGAVVLLVVVVVAVAVVVLGFDRARGLVGGADDQDSTSPHAASVGGRQPSVALVVGDGTSGALLAPAVAVLAHDRSAAEGTVLLVPAGTVADVPGHGSYTVGDAATFGDASLAGVTVDNLLDLQLDGTVGIDPAGLTALVDELGPLDVEVRRTTEVTLPDGTEVRLEAGPQSLDGPGVAAYLAGRSEGETELDAIPRVQQVVAALLARVEEDPAALGPALEAASDHLTLHGADLELLEALLVELADAGQQGLVTTLTLPVSPLGTGRDDLYRVDTDRARGMLDERFAASRAEEQLGAGWSLQVLNGNGIPRIGERVAERLQPGGYRVVLTGNADRFTHEVTRIVVYDDTPEDLAVARDIQERLGVGEIERSGTPQSVVDVTIVVGQDFPPAG